MGTSSLTATICHHIRNESQPCERNGHVCVWHVWRDTRRTAAAPETQSVSSGVTISELLRFPTARRRIGWATSNLSCGAKRPDMVWGAGQKTRWAVDGKSSWGTNRQSGINLCRLASRLVTYRQSCTPRTIQCHPDATAGDPSSNLIERGCDAAPGRTPFRAVAAFTLADSEWAECATKPRTTAGSLVPRKRLNLARQTARKGTGRRRRSGELLFGLVFDPSIKGNPRWRKSQGHVNIRNSVYLALLSLIRARPYRSLRRPVSPSRQARPFPVLSCFKHSPAKKTCPPPSRSLSSPRTTKIKQPPPPPSSTTSSWAHSRTAPLILLLIPESSSSLPKPGRLARLAAGSTPVALPVNSLVR